MDASLISLVEQLPRREEAFAALAPNQAVSVNVPAFEGYVWPGIEFKDSAEVNIQSSPVLLLTAPGAMGKSAAANAVAEATNGIYVDLAKMRVGSGSLTGELMKTLGAVGCEEFTHGLRAGSVTLVLDSTDEAQLRAGTDSFIEFVRDLVWQVSDAAPRSQVLVFGREDSIDLTYLALEELGIHAPVAVISPLSYRSSCEFIDLRLDATCQRGTQRTATHRTHPEPFGRFRDRVFSDLMSALEDTDIAPESIEADWGRTSGFLGYPPVLAALAERLVVENPSEELAKLAAAPADAERRRRGELLRRIVEHILDREHEKVRGIVGERLGIRKNDELRGALYTREEQVARVLGSTGVGGMSIVHPAHLEESERSSYEASIRDFLVDHPFTQGVNFTSRVFSDYARAWAVSSPTREAWIENRDDFESTLPEVGPFYAHFLAALSPEEVAIVPESQVNDILVSHRMGTSSDSAVLVQLDDSAVLRLIEGGGEMSLEFVVSDLSGVLALVSPVARLTVLSDMGVSLSAGRNGLVEVGPDVIIACEELAIRGTNLAVTGRGERMGFSMISAPSIVQENTLSITVHPKNALSVVSENPWHQWKPYLLELPENVSRVSRATFGQVLTAARRILTAFRPALGETLAVSADKVDRLLVGRNPTFVATRDAMMYLGLFSRSGQRYILNLSRMGELDVSWTDLRGDDPGQALKTLCSAIIETGMVNGV